MKANELRIGNYVKHQLFDKTITITGDHIQQLESGMDQDILQGIPITEEWLVNLGGEIDENEDLIIFPLKVKGTFLTINKYHLHYWIEYSDAHGHIESVGLGDIKYIHKLQNLYFALTGEELTLKQ